MVRQSGVGDGEERLREVSATGDGLERIAALVHVAMVRAEFERLFESVKNWGRWGPDDERRTLDDITPEKVTAAAGLVRSGRHVPMAIPIGKVAVADNPNPAVHLMSMLHDVPIGPAQLSFGMCWLGMGSPSSALGGGGTVVHTPIGRPGSALESFDDCIARRASPSSASWISTRPLTR